MNLLFDFKFERLLHVFKYYILFATFYVYRH